MAGSRRPSAPLIDDLIDILGRAMPVYPADSTEEGQDIVFDVLEKAAGVAAVSDPGVLSREYRAARAAKMMSGSEFSSEKASSVRKSHKAVVELVESSGLYGYTVGQLLFLPRWQFEGGRPLRGLRHVIKSLPGDLHPLEVEGFMRTRNASLRVAGRSVTPLRWLALGGEPRVVASLASEVGQW